MKRILISFRKDPGNLKKMSLMPKWSMLFVLIGVFNLQVGAMAQNDQEIVLSMKNVELRDVLWAIEHQTSFTFMYNRQDLDKVGKVSVVVKSGSIDDILKVCLKNTGLVYIVQDDVIVLKPNQPATQERKQVRITGIVRGTDSVPLPGVTVKVKGTTYGTVTDVKGKYQIDIPDVKGAVLVFSFIGMKSVEVKYIAQKEMNVTLHEDVKALEEVTVTTGYQRIEKRYLTSSITTIKAEDILVPGMSSIDQMLEGHVPGMIFMQNSGQLGAAPRLRIRGTSTILGSQEPLWVVDGIVQTEPVNVDPSQINDLDFVNLLGNAISGLNPMDIEQIDILKDASATALYGARAANGVIVISTKKGSVGEPSVSYSFSGTFSRRPRYTDRGVSMMNSAERVDFSREVVEKRLEYGHVDTWVGYDQAIRDYYSGKIDFATFKQQVGRYESVNTDWFDLLMKDSFSHDHTLSVSGGTEKVKYYASVGYSNQDGVLREEMNKRYTTNMKVTANLNRFQVQVGLQGNISERKYTPQDVGLTDYAYNTTRAVPALDENGDLIYYNIADGDKGVKKFNILNERDNTFDKIDANGISFNATVDYRVIDALKFGLTASYSSNNTYQSIYYGEKTHYAALLRNTELGVEPDADTRLPYGGEIRDDNTKNDSYTFRAQLDFNKFLDEDSRHLVMVTLGGEVSSNEYTGLKQTRRAYVPERGNLNAAVDPKYYKFMEWLSMDPEALGTRKDERTRMASLYASASYSYNDLYVLNVNARIDASNKFGSQTNDKLLPIWSVSGRWNAAEDVLENVAWVNTLALRASFGYQGNMLDSETPELIIQRGNMNTVYEKYESTVKSFPNPNLKWEKTASFNTSLDFSFLNDKIQGTLSYYYKKTTDAFLSKTISVINGRPSYTVNKGTLENQGYDIAFNFNPVKTMNGRDGFSWRIDPQIGQVLNQLISKATNQKDKVLRDEIAFKDYLDGNIEVSGRPLNTFYSYKYTGLDPKDGRPMFDGISEMVERDGEEVGRDVIYSEMGKDEVYMGVMEHSGTRVPFIQGGIYNTFSYKGFILSFNLAYSFGSKVRLLNVYPDVQSQYGSVAPRPVNNARKEFVDRWRKPGDETRTDVPGLITNDEFKKTLDPWWNERPYAFANNIWQMYDNSNLRVVSGNYIKMQSLNLRYVLPEEVCKKLFLKSAYVGISGSNLFTICAKELKGQDPSQSGSSGNTNLSVRPTYSVNLSVTF